MAQEMGIRQGSGSQTCFPKNIPRHSYCQHLTATAGPAPMFRRLTPRPVPWSCVDQCCGYDRS